MVFAGYLIAFFALLAIDVECFRRIQGQAASRKAIEYAHQVMTEGAFIKASLFDVARLQAATATPGHDPLLDSRLGAAQKEIDARLAQFRALTKDHPSQSAQMSELEENVRTWLEVPAPVARANAMAADASARSVRLAAMERADQTLEAMVGAENASLILERVEAERHYLAGVGAVAVAGCLQIVLVVLMSRRWRRQIGHLHVVGAGAIESRKQFMDAIGDGILSIDRHGLCTFINKAGTQMLGYEPGELIGIAVHGLLQHSREDGSPYRPEDSRILETARSGKAAGNAQREVEPFWRKDWKMVPVEYTCRPLPAVGGMPSGAVVMFRDVTERRQIENELQEARDLALQSMQLKSEFLANTSHEVRTPMNAILGLAGLLEETPLNAQQKDFVQTIVHSADLLLGLVDDILDFSKGEAGKLTFEQLDFELPAAMEGVVDLVGASAKAKGLELRCTVESNVPEFVCGDAGRLRQVLTNLLSNAIKFTSKGGVFLKVEKGHTPVPIHEAGAWLRFSVRDSGIGIDPEVQKKLFKPFAQADGSMTRRFGGTGLGLAICKQIVEQMGVPEIGGEAPQIHIESRAGEGATFWFEAYFPEAACEQMPKLEGKTVLLVDESESGLRGLQRSIEPSGATLLSAGNGLHALILRPARPFDLAILDLQMTQMNVLQLVAALSDAHPGMKTILMAARGVSDLDTGGLPVVRKPPGGPALFKQINELLPLPRPVAAPPVRAVPVTAPEIRVETPVATRGLRILLAEDNTTNQKVALHQLHRLGHHAHAVANGLELLEMTQRAEFDVILMDCQMPEMDGYEATRQLRLREAQQDVWSGHRAHTWIIALTAHSLTGDREKCLAAGMDDYLSKPARLASLQDALGRAPKRASMETGVDHFAATIPVALAMPVAPEVPVAATLAVKARGMIKTEALDELREVAPTLVSEMTICFQEESLPLLARMGDLSQMPGPDDMAGAEIGRLAHKLKGGAGHLGATEIERLCVVMEAEGLAGNLHGVRVLMPEMKAEFAAVMESLKKYIAMHEGAS